MHDEQADDSDEPAAKEVATDDSLAATLRLILVSGVGPITRKALLEHFGSAQAVLDAPASQLQRVPGVGPKLSQLIAGAKHEIDVETEIQTCRDNGVAIVTEDQSVYPRMLREIHDPPGVLFLLGELRAEDAIAVAIVGTRHSTLYGDQQAERLAGGLARAGITVVSGLARGIDAAAHRGAIAAGGRTIAVLGSGVLNVYPPEHKDLAKDVIRHGALLSEAPPLMQPMSGMFPQRNRIITGMSLGVVVVEAAERSGALVSAKHAMEQGREVFAVPGRVDSRTSRGCHQLIRDGAKLVESVDDILEELGPLVQTTPSKDGLLVRRPAELQLNVQEQTVLNAIEAQPTSIDQVVTTSRLPVSRVLSTISVLEMRRLIRRVSGNLVVRV